MLSDREQAALERYEETVTLVRILVGANLHLRVRPREGDHAGWPADNCASRGFYDGEFRASLSDIRLGAVNVCKECAKALGPKGDRHANQAR